MATLGLSSEVATTTPDCCVRTLTAPCATEASTTQEVESNAWWNSPAGKGALQRPLALVLHQAATQCRESCHSSATATFACLTCRLDLAERIRLAGNTGARLSGGRYGFEAACRTAEQLEQASPTQGLPFSVTVMVLGMSGVGKSATINSILR